MTRTEALKQGTAEAQLHQVAIAIVSEGPHADEHATFDADGNCYGFCPVDAVSTLYPHGVRVEIVHG